MSTRRAVVAVVVSITLMWCAGPLEALTSSQLKTVASAAVGALQNLAKAPTPPSDINKILAAAKKMQTEISKLADSTSNGKRKESLRNFKAVANTLKSDVSPGPVAAAVGAAVQGILALAKAEGV
ncbi:MAG TPA: hypothetical protein VI485_03390 [Vicinamibacterales bacterium]|nr:hypothetical protein [Vicinamibacterales bacterium]